MKKLVLCIIYCYQRFIAPPQGLMGIIFPTYSWCRFTPSCSTYTYQAVELHGIINGLWLGVKRISRCHPFSRVGHDPVPHKV